MQRTVLALALIGCHSADPPAAPHPPPAPAKAAAAPTRAEPAPSPPPIALRELAHYDGDIAVASGAHRTLIVDADANWHELTQAGKLVTAPIGDAINAVCRGHDMADVMLGSVPTVTCGTKGHTYRFEPAAKRIATPGTLEQIAVGHGGVEVWRYDDRGVLRLVVFDGNVTRVASLPALGPAGDAKCAAPSVVDLAANGEVVVGLVSECSPDTPQRVVEYRWPGPTAKVTQLDAPKQLGFRAEQLTVDAKGTITLVGLGDGRLALKRLDGALEHGPAATKIATVIGANDGAVWAVTTEGGLDTRLTRDGVAVPLPDGVQAQDLAFDAHVGVIVKAIGNGKFWLLVEGARN